jgi:hypothetical protein
MKTKSLIAIGVLAGSCLAVQAQDQPERKGRPGPPPEMMKQFDKDGDGQLSEEERKAMREKMQSRMEEQRKEMLEKFDADKDGKLSPEEREKARDAHQAMMLEKFDKDGDGKLSAEERKAMPRPMQRPGGPRGPRGPQGPPPAGE